MNVFSSSLKVALNLAYSSMEECCASNAVMRVRVFLSQQIKMVRSSTGKEYPAFNRRVVRSSRTGPTMDE